MSVLYNRINDLCIKKGITGYRLCKDISMSPNVMTELKMGRRDGLSARNIDKVSKYFGVSVAYLLGTEDEKESPTPQPESERIPNYDKLSDTNRAIVDSMIAQLLAAQLNDQ